MNRYVVEISALLYVECLHDEETLSSNLISQIEELAASSENLLEYQIISHPLPGEQDEPPSYRQNEVSVA